MRRITFILFLVTACNSYAQNFASVGTTWTYSDHELFGNHSSPRGIFSVADSVINGQTTHMVLGSCACGGGNVNFLFEVNRRVYFYNFQSSQFSLLYDFNLNAGENYILHPQNAIADSFYVVVDSTGMDTINGNLRKTQFVHTQAIGAGPDYFLLGKIIEGIGSTNCLYPQFGFCDPPTDGLRCFQDSILGFYETHLAPSCDTVYLTFDAISEIDRMIHVRVAPNPFSETTTLHFEESFISGGSVSVSDITGRIVAKKNFLGNSIVIERNNLERGVYYYHLELKDSKATGKLIID